MGPPDPYLVGTYEAGDGTQERKLALEPDGAFVWWFTHLKTKDMVNRTGTWSSPAPEKIALHVTHDSSGKAALPYDEAWLVERPAQGHATALGREVRLTWTDDLDGEYLGSRQDTAYRLTLDRGGFSYREERGGAQGYSWAGVEGRYRRGGREALDFQITGASSETEVGDHDRTTTKTVASGQVRGQLHRGSDGRVCAIEYQGLRLERRLRT